MAKYKLKDLSLSKLEYGSGAAACAFDGNVRYVRITDITDDGSLASDIVSPSYYEEKHVLQDGDILFARTGATVGKTFLYRKKQGKCVYAGFLIRMVPDCSIVLPDYIYYFTKSPRYRDFVAMNMKVVAQPNINAKQYGDLEIDVPSFKEQQSIVDKLVKIDELIALRKEQLVNLEQLVKSRFIELSNEWGYEATPLQEFLDDITYGFTNPMPDAEEGPWKITAKDVANGKINFDTARKTTVQAYEELTAKSKPDTGTVLLTKDGTLGRCAVVEEDGICVNQSVAVLKCNKKVLPKFLAILLQLPEYQREMLKNAGGGTIKHIYITKVVNMLVMVPDVSQQLKFLSFVEQTEKSKLAIQQSLTKLELLKKSLMQEYFG